MPHIRAPIEHELKTWPEFFERIWCNDKRFELRKNDRDYQGGDMLMLREWSKAVGYSGRAIRVQVTYLLDGEWPGLAPDYVLMSIAEIERFEQIWEMEGTGDQGREAARSPEFGEQARQRDDARGRS